MLFLGALVRVLRRVFLNLLSSPQQTNTGAAPAPAPAAPAVACGFQGFQGAMTAGRY